MDGLTLQMWAVFNWKLSIEAGMSRQQDQMFIFVFSCNVKIIEFH